MAAAYSGQQLGMKTTIILPKTSQPFMVERIEGLGAETIVHGEAWDDADAKARELALDPGKLRELGSDQRLPSKSPQCFGMPLAWCDGQTDTFYVAPFDAPDVWTGNSSIVDELVEQIDHQVLFSS